MTGTDILGLNIINSSDYVSPDPINENMEKLDALGLDYVIESGTSGEWWYRKWKSGRAECGIDYKEFAEKPMTVLVSGGSGGFNLYSTASWSFGSYPFAFASRPTAIITFAYDKVRGNAPGANWVDQQSTESTTLAPTFAMIDTTGTNTAPCCSIYVVGRYK